MAGTQWDGISPEAKQSIKSMLAFKPSRRATAVQLLQQDWFKQAKAVLDKVGQFSTRQGSSGQGRAVLNKVGDTVVMH